MSSDRFLIRRIRLSEGELYRQVRLMSLADSPEAFGSTYESASRRSPASWQEQADSAAAGPDRATFIALGGDGPVGMMSLYRDAPQADGGELIQVWVAPAQRGSRLAGQLMAHLLDWARDHEFKQVSAWVRCTNRRALRFYEKYGFLRSQSPPVDAEPEACLLVKRMA